MRLRKSLLPFFFALCLPLSLAACAEDDDDLLDPVTDTSATDPIDGARGAVRGARTYSDVVPALDVAHRLDRAQPRVETVAVPEVSSTLGEDRR